MGELTWTIRTVGSVEASPEQVMTWWWHPDRRADFRDRIQPTAVDEITQTESTEGGVRLRSTRWKDRKGWVHETQVETPVDADGKPLRREDGSFPVSQKATLTAPLGYKVGFTCTGLIQFKERDAGTTEVTVVHNHKAVGGTWFNRRHMRRINEASEPRDFQEWIDRCRTALDPPEEQESG